ncbi:MAG: polysaccharide deacetylase, partial [Roseiflexaceae bacterium]
QALADAASGTRLRVQFGWRDAQDQIVATDVGAWQEVRRWAGTSDRGGWSMIVAGFQAPAGAAQLALSFHPASDDRVYLDDIQVRRTIGLNLSRDDRNGQRTTDDGQQHVLVQPWPDGYRAALSFSFDWETAMGGLIHSRSDDPNSSQNPLARAMRMRAGVTTTLDLFRPYGIRATYYATGYNFLLGNTEKRQFMGNPTFAWAKQTNRWLDDTWARTPWFADDPYGTVQTDPAWYFGDLVPLLQRERQDIQSHTFSHMDGGLSDLATWRADLATWKAVAAERGVAGARSLAFPWSSSAGMSYDRWDELEQAGISSVTRTNWSQDQYDLFGRDTDGFTAAPHCIPLPGHERILACPDFYLTVQRAPLAIRQLDSAIAAGGMIDLWAHTEEVVSPEQIAAWRQVVSYAARQRDAGVLWVAPLAEIAGWQAAVAELRIENEELRNQGDASTLSFRVHNASQQDLSGVTLKLPFQPKRITVDGMILSAQVSMLNLDIRAGQTVEVIVWPA